MTATYDTGLSSAKDRIRFYIGDTDVTNPLFTDEEISAMSSLQGTDLGAAEALANSAAARYARLVTTSVDGFSASYSDLARQYGTLAQQLRAQAAEAGGGIGSPSVNGVSKGAMDAVDANTDRVPSRFKMGQDEVPGASSYPADPRLLP